MSGALVVSCSRALSPPCALSTSEPPARKPARRVRTIWGSSSTTSTRTERLFIGVLLVFIQRQQEPYTRALAASVADPDIAAVRIHKAFDDSEAQPTAGHATAGVSPVKLSENGLLHRDWNATALV